MKYAGFSLLFLLLGTLIHCTCRQDVIFLLPLQGSELLEAIKIDIHYNGNPLIYFFLFCLSDALWYLALLMTQLKLCDGSLFMKFLFGLSIALPFIWELWQRLNPMLGTFDWFDIFTYLLTLIMFMLCVKRKRLHQFL